MSGRRRLAPGTAVTVSTPATSANLGPGFDTFGLALDWRDEITVEVRAQGVTAVVTGEGEGMLPLDEGHLVLRCVQAALASLEVAAPGLELLAHNTIPHGRGLGSSSAAIVGGLAAGWGLARPDTPLDMEWALRLATEIEGHPDNVAAAVRGGFVLAYLDRHRRAQVVCPTLRDDVVGRVFVPSTPLATATARSLLPAFVPHAEAAANAGRSALLVHALGTDPGLLPEATRDWLHQDYRASAMPASAELCADLRARGYAAVISGAGPTVLVLGRQVDLASLDDRSPDDFVGHAVAVGAGVMITSTAS
ncbi:MAG: homoserine kinase [Propionibacteriaceae bacterium]